LIAGCSTKSEPPITSMGEAESVTDRLMRRLPMMTTGISSVLSAELLPADEVACCPKATDEVSAVTAKAASVLATDDRLFDKKLSTENLQMFIPRVIVAGVRHDPLSVRRVVCERQ
jgi:hypothetical protein